MKQKSFTWEIWLNRWWLILLLAGIVINLLGIFSTIIEPDGALYATIAKTMVNTGDYMNLMFHGKDWLDKPHFTFWITALSFKLLGITTLGYKVPALLFWAMGAFYTYKLASAFYNQSVARLSTLLYLTATHLVISNNDVRAEPYLTGLIVGSVYHFYKSSQKKDMINVVLASAFAACAILTKGIFILITIASGLIIHWLIRKEWNKLFNLRWLVAGIMILLFISPELYCLYSQFDLHPEKIVFETQHVSGIRFFFWDSQFGRFFNTGPIKGDGDPFFFLHTTLWAYFPWAILFFAALYWRAKNYVRDKVEFICLGTIVITFLLFSLSRFQLPHYLNIIFPFMSIVCARYLYAITNTGTERWWRWIFPFHTVLAFGVVIFILIFYQPAHLALILTWMVCFVCLIIIFMNTWWSVQNAFGQTFLASIMLFGFLNIFFVPDMVYYQSGSEAARFLREQNIHTPVVMLDEDSSCSFDFYHPTEVPHLSSLELTHLPGDFLVFCQERFAERWRQEGFYITILKTFPHYAVSQPRGPFINYKTRDDNLERYMIVKVSTNP